LLLLLLKRLWIALLFLLRPEPLQMAIALRVVLGQLRCGLARAHRFVEVALALDCVGVVQAIRGTRHTRAALAAIRHCEELGREKPLVQMQEHFAHQRAVVECRHGKNVARRTTQKRQK
jgi:hypothetical protein